VGRPMPALKRRNCLKSMRKREKGVERGREGTVVTFQGCVRSTLVGGFRSCQGHSWLAWRCTAIRCKVNQMIRHCMEQILNAFQSYFLRSSQLQMLWNDQGGRGPCI